MMKFLLNLIANIFLILSLLPGHVQAHGSVVDEGDLCVINIGFYRAHFKIFQPRTSEQTEFCEDLPDTGESIFVMEYLHNELGNVPIEFRILRDVTGLGRFAQLSDVQAIEDIEAATVFLQKARVEPGVFTVLHQFEGEGDFLGLVTARHPETDQLYSAVFPFHVGSADWGYLPLFSLLVLLAQTGYLYVLKGWRPFSVGKGHTQDRAYTRVLMFFPVFFLLGAADNQPGFWFSESGMYRVSMESQVDPLPLNQIHSWILNLQTAEGLPVENAVLELDGGMPAHNHGLATAPAITANLGNGNYQVEGLRFHMQGDWVMTLTLTIGTSTDKIIIPVSI